MHLTSCRLSMPLPCLFAIWEVGGLVIQTHSLRGSSLKTPASADGLSGRLNIPLSVFRYRRYLSSGGVLSSFTRPGPRHDGEPHPSAPFQQAS
ncbi:hypothetical protein B0T11DRAFT_278749 [Plectosphaerella cucumerina]|uniref:Secreted protein n=1 Tax=Plectosphaerella cucumerina TaxID=40658 RepID=A0A8K0TM56_9PEZI|nr:hypothetical protein B0T11DRAFT_278749 [Plectosphaerella cucumerina]